MNNEAFDTKTYTVVLHLSLLSTLVLPFLGLLIPIIMWLVKKDETIVDQHGRVVVNWMLSTLIYIVAATLLAFVHIGLSILIYAVVGICSITFTIVATIKASQNKLWKYPMSIQIFKVST